MNLFGRYFKTAVPCRAAGAARWLLVAGLAAVLCSCAAISREVRQKAGPPVPFETLMQDTDAYIGRVVILGGYIIRTRNRDKQTEIYVLESPLRLGEEPASRDKSRGRFVVTVNQFLDPEVYLKDRQVTVAGTVRGKTAEEEEGHRYDYLKLDSVEIYLWPEYTNAGLYRCYDPWFYGGFYGGYFWPYGGPRALCGPGWRY